MKKYIIVNGIACRRETMRCPDKCDHGVFYSDTGPAPQEIDCEECDGDGYITVYVQEKAHPNYYSDKVTL